MSLVCPKCDTINLSEASFCKECGNELLTDEVINEDKETVKKHRNTSLTPNPDIPIDTWDYILLFIWLCIFLAMKTYFGY
jgi:uncharacterized membrane protein YvbJ